MIGEVCLSCVNLVYTHPYNARYVIKFDERQFGCF